MHDHCHHSNRLTAQWLNLCAYFQKAATVAIWNSCYVLLVPRGCSSLSSEDVERPKEKPSSAQREVVREVVVLLVLQAQQHVPTTEYRSDFRFEQFGK